MVYATCSAYAAENEGLIQKCYKIIPERSWRRIDTWMEALGVPMSCTRLAFEKRSLPSRRLAFLRGA